MCTPSLKKVKDKINLFGLPDQELILWVSILEQKMFLFRDETVEQSLNISTSRRPPSNVENSLGTPWGLHMVSEKIGESAPHGMIFKGRVAQGKTYHDLPEAQEVENLITSRILRLKGLEPGVNQGAGIDSWERYIYLHGTNREDLLGTPFSSGCILMNNQEIIDLFPKIPVGMYLWIDDEIEPS